MLHNEMAFLINGQKAVDAGYKFQGNYCYRGIYNHGKRIAQLEVVVDEPGEYNGYPQKWVHVTTTSENANETLKQLAKIGFADCWANILYETPINGNECFLDQHDCGWTKI